MSQDSMRVGVPIVPEMIHRPDVPRHMMRLKPAGRRVTVQLGDTVIARSDTALQMLEIGKDVYDPVYYLPTVDLSVPIAANGKSTHCPLKGDTTYYDLPATGDSERVADIGWVYTAPFAFAAELADYIAFDAARVTVTSAPL